MTDRFEVRSQGSVLVRVATEARVFLDGLGLDLAGDQQTKTKTALTFYSSELQALQG